MSSLTACFKREKLTEQQIENIDVLETMLIMFNYTITQSFPSLNIYISKNNQIECRIYTEKLMRKNDSMYFGEKLNYSIYFGEKLTRSIRNLALEQLILELYEMIESK